MNTTWLWALVFPAVAGVAVEEKVGVYSPPREKLVIHEWGTFTSLQDESGNAVGRINSSEEGLPPFVHRALHSTFELGKGAPRLHPYATMRLETPVVYFYPPASWPSSMPIDLEVSFKGGWLTEFYPQADVEAPGLKSADPAESPLTGDTVGRLSWKGFNLDAAAQGPATPSPVWTAPRAVKSTSVKTAKGEAEQYLFYRGIGHLEAPLTVTRDGTARQLTIKSNSHSPAKVPLGIPSAWLADIRPDGTVAYRTLPPMAFFGPGRSLASVPDTFAEQDYHRNQMGALKSAMRAALVGDGLFPDEAEAMLNTWDVSYFKSPGVRLFFLVPHLWTDRFLPLTCSVPSAVTRVMMGRIELVTPQHRQALKSLSENRPKPWTPEYQTRWHALHQQLGRFGGALLAQDLNGASHP